MVMSSMLWKSTFREIKQSMGRFLAILAIVALGVGFFAGLKVTKAAMVKTTQAYLEEERFYDYRVMTTLGLDGEEVELLASKEGVEAAEGAYSYDALCLEEDNTEVVLRFHSLTEDVNGVRLDGGRMPQAPDECLVDSNFYGKDKIGEKIRLSEDNDKADKANFAYEEYTIVGLVRSSLYIQFERGNTSLGTGRISGFVYLLPEGFDSDYFTEAYVKFEEDFDLYSDAYEDFLEEKEAEWEPLMDEIAAGRYDKVQKLSREKLAEARQELSDGRAEGEKELADARKELEDAKQEIEDGEKELSDGRKELEDSRKLLEEKEQELADGEKALEAQERKIVNGEDQLAKSTAQWEEQNTTVENALAELETQQAQLDAQRVPLESQQMLLSTAASQLDSSAVRLDQKEYTLNLKEIQLDQKERDLDYRAQNHEAEKQRIQEQLRQLEEREAQIQTLPEEQRELFSSLIARQKQEIQNALAALEQDQDPEQAEEQRKEIAKERQSLEDERKELAKEREDLAKQKAQLEEGGKQLEEGLAVIASYQAQIDEGRKQLEGASAQLKQAKEVIESSKKQLADGKVEIGRAKAELASGRVQIEDGWKELEEGEQEITDGEAELEEGRVQYEDGLREYEDAYEDFLQEIADAKEEIDDAERAIADMEPAESYILGRNTNVGYVCFESDSSIVDGIANIFPVFFFAVAALVCITTMNRMVEEQRTQIGVLKALGYSEGRIMGKYLFYSGSAAVIGCVLGFFGGTWLFPKVIWTAYGMMYKVDTLLYVFDWKLAVISLAVSCACSIGTTWLSCRYELSEVAAELMRPKAPKAGKRVLLERVPFIWKRLKFLYKVSYRNIFRYKKRFFMMVIGISGCTALLVTGFGIKDSIANIAHDQFQLVQTYDLGVTFVDPMDDALEAKLKETMGERSAGYVILQEKSMDMLADERIKSVNLLVMDENLDYASYLSLHTPKGELLPVPGRGECILNKKLADDYHIETGDTIELQEDNRSMTLKVSGINENFIYNYVYLTAQTYEELMGEAVEYKTAYIHVAEDADVHLLAASLMRMEEVANVSVNADMEERLGSMMQSLDLIVLVVILCAAGLAFIVLYNLTNINITERIREIATIKVLGFYRHETEAYVFRENIVLTLIGALAGLVLGHFLHRFVMGEIRVDMIAFNVRILPVSFLYSVLLTFGFSWFVNRIMGKKLDDVSMTESLKSVD